MGVIADIGFFALLFLVLVFVHELGHFLMAKWMGIKVEKFSLGMGPKIFSFQKGDTEYRLAALPLGGYVKMAGDDPSKEYSDAEKKIGFLTQKPPAKLLVVFGGPVFNLILPIILFGIMLAVGIPSIAPVVGLLQEDLPAKVAGLKSGDRLIAVDGQKLLKWTDFEKIVQSSAGKPLQVEVERLNTQSLKTENVKFEVTPVLADAKSKFGEDIKVGRLGISPEFVMPQIFFEDSKSALAEAGFKSLDRVRKINGSSILSQDQFLEILNAQKSAEISVLVERDSQNLELNLKVPQGNCKGDCSVATRVGLLSTLLVIGEVPNGRPAFKAGLQTSDRLLSINSQKLKNWDDVLKLIKGSEGRALEVAWSRGGKEMKAVVTPELTEIKDPIMGKDSPTAKEPVYQIGIAPMALMDADYVTEQSWSPVDWLNRGLTQTWEMTSMTVIGLFKLVTGQLSLKALGSPIMIYKLAGNSYRMAGGGKHGWVSFLSLLALLSITLGVINLFPIPVLDGGHAVFFTIEWIRGRPLSLKVMEWAMQAGLFILICVFVVALYNDFSREGWLDPVFRLLR